jgi:hypothetical protein
MAFIAAGAIIAASAARFALHRLHNRKNALLPHEPADFLVVENDEAELHIGMLVCFSGPDGHVITAQSAATTRNKNSWELKKLCATALGIEGEASFWVNTLYILLLRVKKNVFCRASA